MRLMGAYASSGLIAGGKLMSLLNSGFVSHVHLANQGLYRMSVLSPFPMTILNQPIIVLAERSVCPTLRGSRRTAGLTYRSIINQLGQTYHDIPSARTLARISRCSPTIWFLPTGQPSALRGE